MKSGLKVVNPAKEGHDTLDSIIGQDIERGSFLSFPRTDESPLQWIQLLHALDQQGSSRFSNGTKVDNGVEGKGRGLDISKGVSSFKSEMNVSKESVSLKSSGLPAKVTKSTSQQMQALSIPEAVVTFVQAAAKANSQPEKYLPGWPLLSPSKVQLQKCDKCSREFCSSINYRRHIRVHRRSLNIDKDSLKNRGLLGAFWDKLSLDGANEILTFENVAIEEVTGSSVMKALTSLIRKPRFFSLPEIYVKAGMTLLDVVQATASRLPIFSQELFSALDDASEKTFLCAGTALSIQKFVFDGETGKMALEMKNLIACASFMLEKELVKAWLADKDAEALRCQKLLVEEEEAAQKRQSELLERKRLKKLRQKEQKKGGSTDTNKADFSTHSPETVEGTSGSTASPSSPSESDPGTPEDSPFLDRSTTPDSDVEANSRMHLHTADADQSVDHQLQVGNDHLRSHLHMDDADPNIDHGLQMGSGQQQPIAAYCRPLNPSRYHRNGSRSGPVPEVRGSVLMKHGSYRDPKSVGMAGGHRIWTRKTKPEKDGVNREQREPMDVSDRCEVLIGSISVRLEDGNEHRRDNIPLRRNNYQQKMARPDTSLNSANRSVVKLWRPLGNHQSGDSATVASDRRETNVDGFHAEAANQIPTDESRPSSGVMDGNFSDSSMDSSIALKSGDLSGPILFSSHVAEAFLAQRWREAIAADHVMLPLSPETTETSDDIDITTPKGNCAEAPMQPSDFGGRRILGSAENRMSVSGSFAKFAKPEKKSHRMKYVPKQ